MNPKKLDDYQLKAGVHTVQLRCPGIVQDIPEEVADCMDAISTNQKKASSTCIINANKLTGDIFKYSEFETALSTILAGAGISEYNLIRTDLKLDNYDADHYRKFQKLNKYLISLLAVTYRVQNAYKTVNLFSNEQLSVAIKNKYLEAENYDKNAESGGKDPAQARLELRSKALKSNDIKQELMAAWFVRLDKTLENTELCWKRYNDELERIYWRDKDAFPVRFTDITHFLIIYQECIFSSKQMVDLLSRLKVDNPAGKAKYHKKHYGCEYFSQEDLKRAVKEIKRATATFFEN